jgi:hypothetical protein
MDWLWTSSSSATATRCVATAIGLAALVTSDALPAAARGGHGFAQGRHSHDELGMRGTRGDRSRSRGNDPYVQAASRDLDRVLNHRIKSICRGC